MKKCLTCDSIINDDQEKCQKCVNKILLKGKLFYHYTNFYTLSDLGSSLVGRIMNFLPSWGTIILELGALTIIFSKYNIAIPWYLIILFLIGKKYVWMVLFYISGKVMKRTGFIKASSEYSIRNQEHFNPWQEQAQKTIENIALKVGAKTEFIKYEKI